MCLKVGSLGSLLSLRARPMIIVAEEIIHPTNPNRHPPLSIHYRHYPVLALLYEEPSTSSLGAEAASICSLEWHRSADLDSKRLSAAGAQHEPSTNSTGLAKWHQREDGSEHISSRVRDMQLLEPHYRRCLP
jgi:hypothetical protein